MLSRMIVSIGSALILMSNLACASYAKEQNVLVGSIPGDAITKRMLAIDASENIDFIRLRIALNEGGRKFDLTAAYGIGKPNTREFENGGKSLAVKGRVEVKESDGYLTYRLFNEETGVNILLIRLNDQIFHLLSDRGKLLAGNGGWNYTLSRETWTSSKADTKLQGKKVDTSNEPGTVVFSGRTPCLEIARELKMAYTEECFKLKWKLTLNRDPETKLPTTFTLQRTFRRAEPLEGRWRIVKDGNAHVYRLKANDGSELSFLRIDESLFFLDNAGRLLKGNGDFGYTLDKHQGEKPGDLQKAIMK